MSRADNSFIGLLKMNTDTYELEIDHECTILVERIFNIFLDPSWNREIHSEGAVEQEKNGKRRTKGKAVLKFIYLVEDIRSHIHGDEEKCFSVCKLEKWMTLKELRKNEQINSARERYREIQNKDSRIRLMSSLDSMANNLIDHIARVNFNDELDNGSLKYDPIKYTKLMDEVPAKVQSLHENKKNVLAAFAGKNKALGDREIGMYEE